VGNLIDRIVYGGVRDFLVMPGWFVFNFADVWISIGVVLLIWSWFFVSDKHLK
jgi:signal peptidase II